MAAPKREEEDLDKLVKTRSYLDGVLTQAYSLQHVDKGTEEYHKKIENVKSSFNTKCENYQEILDEYRLSKEPDFIPEIKMEVNLQEVSKDSSEPIKIYAANQYLKDVKQVGKRISTIFQQLNEQEASKQITESLETIENRLEN